jgi:hypothetical protein
MYPVEQGNYTIPYTGPGLIVHEMGIGETRTVTVRAKEVYNFVNVYVRKDQRFEFSCNATDQWKNGSTESNANGYAAGIGDLPRQGSYRMMAMVGELFRKNGDIGSFTGTHFSIGTSRTWTAPASGFLNCFANDNMLFYGGNSGAITLTVRRVN